MHDKGANDPGRRGVLKLLSGLLTLGIGAAMGLPGLGYFLSPLLGEKDGSKGGKTGPGAKVRLGGVDTAGLKVDQPQRVDVVTDRRDAWTLEENVKLGSVWLVKRQGGKVDCYSTVCPHLGCAVDYDEKNKRFACPCHDSVFAVDSGKVVSGPSPRPMDPLELEHKDNALWVLFQKFRQGTSNREPV
jgi:menaquinol-cytochrome c reductase iron-sulfur subunit